MRIFGVLLFSLMLIGQVSAYAADGLLKGVEHFKQSTVKIQGEKVVYFDLYRFDGEPRDGDLIFITHPHGDHLSIADIQKVMKPNATIILPEDGAEKVKAAGLTNLLIVSPNKSYEVAGIKFETVPAYNIGKQFHPRDKNWVGYIVTINKTRYYIPGDTDFIPEMKNFKADVGFFPVGGKYTMTAAEAAKAANIMKPKIAAPIHFLDVVGTMEDAKQFVAALDPGIEGVILKK